MRQQATSITYDRAKSLRASMTDAERALWQRLRREQLGVKFRRQHPLDPFIADFACLAPKMVVELDGSQHQEQKAYDLRRDAFFASKGFTVLRFWTDEPLKNMDGVLAVIAQQIELVASSRAAVPPPQPSPGRGGS
jgi:BirA family biotin operon repressor/biotin-[acetyl-CoA-carboxylase] ligase/primosomal protein N' (replication factor Y)